MEIQRLYLGRKDFKAVHKALRQSGVFFFQGTSSIYCPTVATKWLIDDDCIWWDNQRLTPGEIAKYELGGSFPGLERVGWSPKTMRLLGYRPPSYCISEHKGDFVHVDINGAYWQAYERLWLDLRYPCGVGGILDLAPLAYRLRDCKPARNALIGITRSTTTVGMKHGRSLVLRSKNPFLSPPLWATIQSWLNEIAIEARRCGMVYWHIDGGFFPIKSNWQWFLDWLTDYGIDHRSKRVGGHILGHLSYDMAGHKTTTPYKKGARGRINHIRNYAGGDEKIIKWWYSDVLNWRSRIYENGTDRP